MQANNIAAVCILIKKIARFFCYFSLIHFCIVQLQIDFKTKRCQISTTSKRWKFFYEAFEIFSFLYFHFKPGTSPNYWSLSKYNVFLLVFKLKFTVNLPCSDKNISAINTISELFSENNIHDVRMWKFWSNNWI